MLKYESQNCIGYVFYAHGLHHTLLSMRKLRENCYKTITICRLCNIPYPVIYFCCQLRPTEFLYGLILVSWDKYTNYRTQLISPDNK